MSDTRRLLCEVCLASVSVADALIDSDEDGRPIVYCSEHCAAEDCDELDPDEARDPIAADTED